MSNYLRGTFTVDVLEERKIRLEATISTLSRERDSLATYLNTQALTDERIQTILKFAEDQAHNVELATQDFSMRQRMIEELDVRVTLAVEQEQKVIYARCILGKEAFRDRAYPTD